MAILTLLLGVLLLGVGLGALAISVDLLPTDMGRLYVESGVAFLCAGAIVLAVAALIHKLDRIVAPQRKAATPAPAEEPALEEAPIYEDDPPAEFAPAVEPAPVMEEEEVNFNRSGRLPSLHEMEEALVAPERQPKIIGRYSAGGARYDVFSDGSIEAETEEGGVRFPSMTEFKAYIASRKL